jgi:hypothetical protein
MRTDRFMKYGSHHIFLSLMDVTDTNYNDKWKLKFLLSLFQKDKWSGSSVFVNFVEDRLKIRVKL